MHASLYTKRSEISGIWIAITVLAIFLVVGSISFGNSKNVYAVNDLNVKVDVDDDEIERDKTQKITVTVTKDGNSDDAVNGADVKLTVYPPETDSTTAKDETDEDGKANFDVKIADDAEYGTYEVKVKVSKDGFNTNTEDSSFEVTGQGNNENDETHDDDSHEDESSGKDDDDDDNEDDNNNNNGGHDSDNGENYDGESNSQALSQGNSCGNGVLSTNILCQNVANQLQGDGNAINIIAMQDGGGDDDDGSAVGNTANNPSVGSSSISSVPPTSHDIQQSQGQVSGSTSENPTESIVDQYVQARLNHAIETRLNYLK
jgi:5-hydroxyisourate hydrolase-like protein (transthyretin family)